MLDLGWSELLLVVVLTVLVFGPKELPTVLRTVSKWVNIGKNLARDFQNGLDDVAREAELDELKKSVAEVQNIDIDDALDLKDKPADTNTIGGETTDLDAFDVPDQPEFGPESGTESGTGDAADVTQPNIDVADMEPVSDDAAADTEPDVTNSAGAKA